MLGWVAKEVRVLGDARGTRGISKAWKVVNLRVTCLGAQDPMIYLE